MRNLVDTCVTVSIHVIIPQGFVYSICPNWYLFDKRKRFFLLLQKDCPDYFRTHVYFLSAILSAWPSSWSLPIQKNFGPTHTTELPGHKPLVVNVVVVGPFEEEEAGIGITSDVVKVKGEDQDTPGYLKGDRVRRRFRIVGASPLARSWSNPGTVTIPQDRFHKTKQRTHTKMSDDHFSTCTDEISR